MFSLKRLYDNSIYSNEGSSCKESFSCDDHFGILYFRVGQLTKSLLQINAIVADANVIDRDPQMFQPVPAALKSNDDWVI